MTGARRSANAPGRDDLGAEDHDDVRRERVERRAHPPASRSARNSTKRVSIRRLCSSSAQARKYVDWPTNATRRRPPAGGADTAQAAAARASAHSGRGYAAGPCRTGHERITHETPPAHRRRGTSCATRSSRRWSARRRCGSISAAARASRAAAALEGRRRRAARCSSTARPRRSSRRRASSRAGADDAARPTSPPPTGTDAVRAALEDAPAGGVVTCFEALPHLDELRACRRPAARAGDAARLHGRPERAQRRVLVDREPRARDDRGARAPSRSCAACCPPITSASSRSSCAGSAIAPAGEDAELPLADAALTADRVASHFFLAFGPQAHRLTPQAGTRQADAGEERRRERERSSRLALLEARVQELESAR